uniref:DUF4378 domain-containing protein n=1 Tax=Brugia timori TaxID=42155 RepID=A0A0R3QRP8_9BILA
LFQKNRSRTHSFPFSTLLTTVANDSIPGEGLLGSLEDSDKITPTSSPVRSPSSPPTLVASTCSATIIPNHMHQCATVPSGVNLMNKGTNEKQEGDSEETEVESDDDDDDLTSSDGSYVKVAFGSSESLADGLGEFMKQCRSAPTHLSFQIDSTSVIPELLAQFENNQKIFDNFLEEIKRKADNEED